MSPGDSAEGPLRLSYSEELEQLSLQVEMMGVVVDQNLERMREVLHSGDEALAAEGIAVDDQIDSMNVSLMERCYELLRLEAPVASDLRLVVSVLRVTAELERIGDLALRVLKLAPDHALLRAAPRAFDILQTMADDGLDRYRDAPAGLVHARPRPGGRVATEPTHGSGHLAARRGPHELQRARRRSRGAPYHGRGPGPRPHRRPRR